MSEHPTSRELRQWIWGGLRAARNRAVARHLLGSCADCQKALAPYAAFAAAAEPLPEEIDGAYDAALERALPRARRAVRRADRLARDKEKLLPILLAERRPSQAEEPSVHPVARVEALLEAAWQIRFQDPIRMGHLAERAKNCAECLTSRQAGSRVALADLRCRCWLVLANALRVRDELSDAHPALKWAFSYFEEGTQNADLAIQLHEVLAALCADERDFVMAEEAAHAFKKHARSDNARWTALLRGRKPRGELGEPVSSGHCPAPAGWNANYRIARDERDFHRAGRALIQAGTYFGWAGRSREAVSYLEKARRLIDRERDPTLEDVILQNMADFLVDCKEFKRARRLVFELQGRFASGGKDLLRLKLRGVQAKIHFGLGDLEKAEREYLALGEGLQKAGRSYPAALAELELSVVYLAQVEKCILAERPAAEGQPLLEKFYHTVVAALAVFKELHIDREALGAVILLENSLRAGRLSRSELEKIIAALRTADRSPRRKLPDEPV